MLSRNIKRCKLHKSNFTNLPKFPRRMASTGKAKFEYQLYESSEGDAEVSLKRWRIQDPEVMKKVMSYPFSKESGLEERMKRYPTKDLVTTKPVFDQYYFLPRAIYTFGRSGKRVWADPFYGESSSPSLDDRNSMQLTVTILNILLTTCITLRALHFFNNYSEYFAAGEKFEPSTDDNPIPKLMDRLE